MESDLVKKLQLALQSIFIPFDIPLFKYCHLRDKWLHTVSAQAQRWRIWVRVPSLKCGKSVSLSLSARLLGHDNIPQVAALSQKHAVSRSIPGLSQTKLRRCCGNIMNHNLSGLFLIHWARQLFFTRGIAAAHGKELTLMLLGKTVWQETFKDKELYSCSINLPWSHYNAECNQKPNLIILTPGFGFPGFTGIIWTVQDLSSCSDLEYCI